LTPAEDAGRRQGVCYLRGVATTPMQETAARAGWRGVIEEYRRFLPVSEQTPVITMLEGGTPLIEAPRLSERVGARVWLKFEGLNPTCSFKDRGMTMAISKALERKAPAVICASTGNTSASAAAYAARAGMRCMVLIPNGNIALGKLSQAMIHGASVLAVEGNFDDALRFVREIDPGRPPEAEELRGLGDRVDPEALAHRVEVRVARDLERGREVHAPVRPVAAERAAVEREASRAEDALFRVDPVLEDRVGHERLPRRARRVDVLEDAVVERVVGIREDPLPL